MARSYKKAFVKDRNPFMKNYANRLLRRHHYDTEIPSGKHYRKWFESWSISDWSWSIEEPTLERLEVKYRQYPWWRFNNIQAEYKSDLLDWVKLTGNKRAHRVRGKSVRGNGLLSGSGITEEWE